MSQLRLGQQRSLRKVNERLRLWPGNEHARSHSQHQVSPVRGRHRVLERLPVVQAASPQRLELVQRSAQRGGGAGRAQSAAALQRPPGVSRAAFRGVCGSPGRDGVLAEPLQLSQQLFDAGAAAG